MNKNISVIGIGRLGLCFALTLEKAGYNVLGVDINANHVKKINNKTLKSSEPNVENYLKRSKNFHATTNLVKAVKHSDILFVLVATPSLDNGEYDHKQIDGIIEQLHTFGKQKNKHLIIGCTVMPGYCDSIQNKLNLYGYTVSYNPEFIAQGNILHDQINPDIVLIGEGNKKAGDIIQSIYMKICYGECKNYIHRMTPISAEITKLALNCFITTKIAYANFIGDLARKVKYAQSARILSAIGADSRIGHKCLKYGYGYGGLCFPRDNEAFSCFCEQNKINTLIPDATHESNKEHLYYMVRQFKQSHLQKQIHYDLPAAFKPGTTIIEKSQQLEFAVRLAKDGYNIVINDNEQVIKQVKKLYGKLFKYKPTK